MDVIIICSKVENDLNDLLSEGFQKCDETKINCWLEVLGLPDFHHHSRYR